jgi:hypothetical protein
MRHTTHALVVVALLALAPAALAKGPHASIASGPAGIDPGKPWVTTLTLAEYSGEAAAAARPRVILRSGSARFAVDPRRIALHVPERSDMFAEARYRIRVVFPRAGRWTYTVVDGERRFRFPAARIGGGAARVTTGYVEFPQGSRAHREDAGGAIVADALPTSPQDGGGARPPEVMLPPEEPEDGGGLALWIPAAGLTLAGVGTVTLLRRRR